MISNVSRSQPIPGILIRPLGRNMSGKEESEEGVEGFEGGIVEKGEDKSSTHPHLPPFTLLLHILQSNGLPVPTALFTAANTAELVREVTGTLPVSVDVVTDREAVVSLKEGVLAVGIAQQLQGSLVWGPHHTEVTCLLSSKDSILKVVEDRETARQRLEELETKRKDAISDCERQTDQFGDMLKKFSEEVRRIEELEKKVSEHQPHPQPEAISTAALLEQPDSELIQPKDIVVQHPPVTYVGEAHSSPRKLMKTLDLPPFSGADPVPKDEGSWEQWEFQVRGFLDTHTPEAVCSALIHSVRGAARELVGFVGYQAELDVILKSLEKRFGKKLTGDKLQQDFYQISQEKGEKVKAFTGRLEQVYRKLQDKFPGKYDMKQLKDRLFYGMSQHLRDSMRFLYKKDTTGYEELLEASQEAEGEWTDNKTVRVKNAQVGNEGGLKALRDQINALASVITSNGKGNYINKGNQQAKPKQDSGKNSSKSKGPEPSAHGPYKDGQKPLQCYKCGGWGHTAKICPSSGNQNWRILNGVDNPPKPTDPIPQKK